jgi:magnesium transporter
MLRIATAENPNLVEWSTDKTPPSTGLRWADLQSPTEAELGLVQKWCHAPAALLEAAADTQTTVRADAREGWLLLITRGIENSDGMRVQHLGLLVNETCLISIHEEKLPDLEDVSHDWRVEPTKSGADLLYYLLDALLDNLFPILDEIEDKLYEVEETIISGQIERSIILNILRTSRQLLVIRKIGSALRETANTVLRRTSQQEAQWARFQEAYDHASRIVDIAETLHEIASGTIDANLATISNQLNEVMKTLTIMATILMTVSLISGIFGMNFAFPGVIKEQTLHGFWISVGSMAAAVTLLLVWFKKKRYIG